ncbi:hypothetical protein F4820DRAFT_458947 [Hypoxylon rubiginosum]|uniref:Uncharacterized protein n=1 Tax=Hypoxylon rubiginosum TaxID=110542 RepID=A0ACB9YZ30_9PEZI|nr:hypothetical protein F4820DRAFT_458947 [Hypoxylon rubiginosum]
MNWYGRTTKGPYDQLTRVDDEFYDQQYSSQFGAAAIDRSQSNIGIPNYAGRRQSSETAPPQVRRAMPDEPHSLLAPWLPYTLRWPYLSITVVILHAISARNFGIVDDNESGGIVVGSKFVPTTLAVIYVLWISIMLDDVKRTEPFARLASPSGALAESSLTWTADAWWTALFDSFPNRSRNTDLAMLFSAITFILGFLVVSPLSSTLLVSQDVVFTRDAKFSQIDMASSMPLQANPFSATYFRAISNILQNVTTSAWLTEKYAVLPFWPDEITQAPLSPFIANDILQTWAANTTVFSAELDCEDLEFAGVKTAELSGDELFGTTIGISVDLSSRSGCEINLRLDNISSLATSGGAIWSAMGDVAHIDLDQNDNTLTTNSCPQDEVVIFTTPLTNGTAILSNATVTGAACRAFYYVADTQATVALGEGRTLVTIDEPRYLTVRAPIPDRIANMSAFKDVFFASNWTTHVNTKKLAKTNHFESPFASGPANLLSALYNFSPEQLVADQNVTTNMQKIKQRFLAEIFRDAFDRSSSTVPVGIPGNVLNNVRRLVVVPAVAITLEVVIAIQLLLLATIFVYTRPTKRPLGLMADPASSTGLAKLLANEPDTLQSLEYLYDKPTEQLNLELVGKRYQLTGGGIHLVSEGGTDGGADGDIDGGTANRYSPGNGFHRYTERWQVNHTAEPEKVFKFWTLLALFALLTSILISIAVLFWYNNTSGLYQTAFVYAIDISANGINLGPINPASIITTLIAVCIGLWWGSLDTTLRRVQPFLALAKESVIGSKGVSVSYRSSYLLWAAFRAVKRRHLVLVLICTGAFFAEIFTIAMSSLWDRGPGTVSSTMEIPRQLQLRNVPLLSTGTLPSSPSSRSYKVGAISSLFSNMRTSWIFGAAVQLSLNGSEPPWSSDGWNFVPSDLSLIPQEKLQNVKNDTAQLGLSTDITLETPAIRGRLECSQYDFLSNTSMWLTERNLKDAEIWNITASPNILSRGYELGLPIEKLDVSAYSLQQTTFFLNPPPGVYDGRSNFSGDYTSFFVDSRRLQCCQNTTNEEIGESSVGYWSFNQPNGTSYPDVATTWPANFTVKWIRGRPIEGYKMAGEWPSDDARTHMIWAEKPQMTAINCMPVIETANASVTVNAADGRVLDFQILDTPRPDEFAWTDDFTIYQTEEASLNSTSPNHYDANLTTSHGVLFLLGLLGAADIDNFGGIAKGTMVPEGQLENVEDQTFNIRDPGLNVDLLTYSMLSLVENDHQALLDVETLKRTTQQTFATLFQHFVNNNVTPKNGGYAYQSINETFPDDIGLPREPQNNTRPIEARVPPETVTLHISRPVELLQMSGPAAWICIILLAYLLITCVILTIAARQYNKLLPKQVNSIADVAVLLAGSDKLLAIARETSIDIIKYDAASTSKLGWFQDGNGAVRWGVELTDKVGGR